MGVKQQNSLVLLLSAKKGNWGYNLNQLTKVRYEKTRKTVWPFDFGVNNVKACLISTNQAGSGGVMLWEILSWSTLASYSVVPKGSLAGRLKQLGIAPPTFCAQPTHY